MDTVLTRDDYLGSGDSGSGFHVCIEVPDLDLAIDFYGRVLGLPIAWRQTFSGEFLDRLTEMTDVSVEVAQLACPGGSRIELAQFDPQGQRDNRRIIDAGLHHISFGFRDPHSVYERLIAAGVPFASPVQQQIVPGAVVDRWWVAYFYDPWGHRLELFSPDPETGDNPKLF